MAGLVNVVKWQVPKENHDDMVKLMSGGIERDGRGIDEQRWHPENILYSRTRTFYRNNDDDPNIEDWFFMDEYDDPELFKQQIEIWKNSTDTVSYAKEHHARWKKLRSLVPLTKNKFSLMKLNHCRLILSLLLGDNELYNEKTTPGGVYLKNNLTEKEVETYFCLNLFVLIIKTITFHKQKHWDGHSGTILQLFQWQLQ